MGTFKVDGKMRSQYRLGESGGGESCFNYRLPEFNEKQDYVEDRSLKKENERVNKIRRKEEAARDERERRFK
jgi:hypothetical protein